jgi:hypothetical protein
MVTFVSVDNASNVATGITDAQGKFSLQTNGKSGAPIGKHNVGIAKAQGEAQVSPEEAKKMTMQLPDPSKMRNVKLENELPKQYAAPNSSGLTKTVESGKSNDFVFDLDDGAGGGGGAGEKSAEKPAENATK